jgi:hypothetical protein
MNLSKGCLAIMLAVFQIGEITTHLKWTQTDRMTSLLRAFGSPFYVALKVRKSPN